LRDGGVRDGKEKQSEDENAHEAPAKPGERYSTSARFPLAFVGHLSPCFREIAP
jgi:hypothetical protein